MTSPSEFWKIASGFPADKEAVYPDHARAQEFDSHKNKTVLEYGCGGGSDVISYAKRGCIVYFTDIVPANVEATTGRANGNGFAQQTVGTLLPEKHLVLPFRDGQFDVVSSHGVMHHIPEPLPVLKEFYRVLQPGGLVYIMLYTEHLWKRFEGEIQAIIDRAALALIPMTPTEAFGWCTDGHGCPYAEAYTQERGEEFLRSAGFVPLSVVEFNEEPPLFRTFKAMKPWGARPVGTHGW